jgi:S1-C subfamily serine protease
VLTSDGEILTNNHVINGATSVKVTDIGNGKTYKATVVGYEDSQDVAVLQLSGASGLKTAPIGDSSTVGVGDRVVGLGNAGGVGGTPSVAPGEVTALNHSITASDESSGTSEQLSGLIQSNADIQAGDSGGPLVNQYGEVVGIDTAALSGSQFGNGNSGFGGSGNSGSGNEGAGNGGFGGSGFGSGDNGASSDNGSSNSGIGSTIQGYSIPINTATSIADQIEAGKASSTIHIGATAFLGIVILNSSSGSATGTGQETSGVEISDAASGTPAAQAGLTAGDVITSVAGHTVGSSTSIQQVLEGYHPGDKVTIDWTDTSGQSHSTTVTLASGPAA